MVRIHFIIILSLLLFTACGGDSDSARPDNSNQTITVSDQGSTVNISTASSQIIDIDITGNNNTVSVTNNIAIGKLNVTGANNLINIKAGVTIDICVLDGSDNTLNKPLRLILSCTIAGLGNSIINF